MGANSAESFFEGPYEKQISDKAPVGGFDALELWTWRARLADLAFTLRSGGKSQSRSVNRGGFKHFREFLRT